MANFDEKCKQFFQEADTDGTGSLTKLELAKVLQKAGVNRDPSEIVNMFDDLDKNDDDKVTLDEFMGEVAHKIDVKDKQVADLRRVFREIDTDNSGYISLDELKAAVAAQGHDPEGACLDLDTNDDGRVSCEEFLEAFGKTL